MRSLSVVAEVALNDQPVESDDDTTQGSSKPEVEGDKIEKAQEQPADRVERLPHFNYLIVRDCCECFDYEQCTSLIYNEPTYAFIFAKFIYLQTRSYYHKESAVVKSTP